MWENERGELVTASILAKERMHRLADDFTAPAQDERARHKVVANGWHWGTAVPVTILLTCFPPAAATAPIGRLALGPVGYGTLSRDELWMTQSTCIQEHWQGSHARYHPAAVADPLEQGLRQTIRLWLARKPGKVGHGDHRPGRRDGGSPARMAQGTGREHSNRA